MAVLGVLWGAGSKDRDTTVESCLSMVCCERRWGTLPYGQQRTRNENSETETERTQGTCPAVSSSVRKAGSTKPMCQGHGTVAPHQGTRAWKGESGLF